MNNRCAAGSLGWIIVNREPLRCSAPVVHAYSIQFNPCVHQYMGLAWALWTFWPAAAWVSRCVHHWRLGDRGRGMKDSRLQDGPINRRLEHPGVTDPVMILGSKLFSRDSRESSERDRETERGAGATIGIETTGIK